MNAFLRKPEFSHYNISDHLEFHTLAYPICNGIAFAIGDLSMITDYQAAIAQEETVYKYLRMSEYTAKKAETDHKRDGTLTGIRRIVRLNLSNFDPSLRDNAVHVDNLLKSYGDVKNVDYDGETAAIDSILSRLFSENYLPAATALGLVPWLNELQAQNNLFKTYVEDAAQEQIKKPAISPRNARQATDLTLRRITDRVTALVNLNGPVEYTDFADAFNTLVTHYNTLVHEHYGRLHARIDIAPSTIGMIPEQPFTGKPVFVIPELTLTIERDGKQTTLKPLFSEDFTVAYQNNVNPGTATLIIKGIGKYTGEITTTFNIE